MSKHFPHIFEPFTVKRTTFRNRVVMPPMGSNYATYSGEVSEEMKDYYGLRARGGTALITVENACIDFPLATNGTKQLRIDGKQFMPGLFELTERIHKYGALASIQLNHAGASAYPERLGGLQSVSSSSVNKAGNPEYRSEIRRCGRTCYRCRFRHGRNPRRSLVSARSVPFSLVQQAYR